MKHYIGKHCDYVSLILASIGFPTWALYARYTPNLGNLLIFTVFFMWVMISAFAFILHCERQYSYEKQQARLRHPISRNN